MSTITVEKDTEALSFTITARFDAPLERVWQVWSDPRQLERWWGPPTYPATVTEHDLTPGGRVAYYMTGPEGDRHHGWWEVVAVEAPHRLEFDDGFAEPDGSKVVDGPVTRAVVSLTPTGDGTEMEVRSAFPSAEVMEQMVEMGMEEGMTLAMGQIDGILLDAG
ncbi:MAG TPA: SRPBCC domain-containing protein [Ornithinibacter sp.]|jgi:uncharacterized protein YndB with AHSA1/START domain|nr:SRPBCC domain-containing protein [Ornithinibacter sp.]